MVKKQLLLTALLLFINPIILSAKTDLSVLFQSVYPKNSVITTSNIANKELASAFLLPKLYLKEIPSNYQDYFHVEFEGIENARVGQKLLIKGFNRLGGKVIVNAKEQLLNSDGNFESEISFDSTGFHSIFIIFTTIHNKILAIEKRVFILDKQPGNQLLDQNREDMIYFNKSDFLLDSKLSMAESEMNRKQLAYFLYKLRQKMTNTELVNKLDNALYVADVNKESNEATAIAFVLNQHIMGEYPDGLFYPDKKITELEFVVSLVRALKLPLSNERSVSKFADVDQAHWAYKFLRAAEQKNILTNSTNFQANSPLIFAELVNMTKTISPVKEQLLLFKNSVKNDILSPDILFANYKSVLQFNDSQKTSQNLPQKIMIQAPESLSIVYDNSVEIRGKVFPPGSFDLSNNINNTPTNKTISSNDFGEFTATVNLQMGRNDFRFNSLNDKVSYSLFFLEPYSDINSKTLKEKTAQLKFLSLLPDTPSFNATATINRELFIQIIKPFIADTAIMEALPTSNKGFSTISDIDTLNDKYFVSQLVWAKIFSLNSNKQFDKNKPLTRIEAVTALARLMQLGDHNKQGSNTQLTYWDMPKKHWAYSYLTYAYDKKIVSDSVYFYPKNLIIKQDLISMLSKLPWVEEKINETFYAKNTN
jgi:hypothetical protein